MNGVPQDWLQNVYKAYSPAPQTASTVPIGPSTAPTFGLPTEAPPVHLPAEIGPPPPPPVPPPPPAPQAAAAPPPVVPPEGARSGGNEYPLQAIPGGGVIAAHEVERRGPSLLAAQAARNEAAGNTIADAQGRNEEAAALEFNAALQQERMARARDAAAQQSLAEQHEEMAQRQADFDSTVRQLSKMGTIDRGRLWASKSVPQKIAGFVELALSGFNRAPSMVMKAIDDDVKAQEFAYYATRDTAQAKQTAFSAAMQKYQNADAARAAARAASLDVVQGMFSQVQAKWKGTEAANRAGMAFAALQDEKANQIANGIQFVLPQSTGRRFYDPRTGLTYSEAEAKAMSAKVDERDFENRKQTAGIGGQLVVEDAKAEHELAKAQAGKADEGAHQISNQLQQAGVPAARVAAEEALAALNKSRGGRLEAAARKVLPESAGNAVMSDDANEREQKYQAFANAAMKAMMGNVTAGEEERARKALGSAQDPESRMRAIRSALATLEEIEKNAKAGASPAAQAEFDRRRENAKGDKPAAPPSAAKGW